MLELAVARHPSDAVGRTVDLIGGPGALRSLAAVLGTLLVLQKCKTQAVGKIIGISGGSLALVMLAAGYSVPEIIRIALDIRFEKLVHLGRSHHSVVASHLASRRRKQLLPADGVYCTDELGQLITKLVAARTDGWPSRFVTVALDATDQERTGKQATELPQIYFSVEGIFRRWKDGRVEKLSDRPAPIGLAIRAACAVPMILEPIQLPLPSGETLTLFDGALSWEGAVPFGLVDTVAPDDDHNQIVVDVGDERGPVAAAVFNTVKLICGGQCLARYNAHTIAGDERRVLVAANITALSSFEFTADSDKKWLAIAEGLTTAFASFVRRGLLDEQDVIDGQEICRQIRHIGRTAVRANPGHITRRMEELLVGKGWL